MAKWEITGADRLTGDERKFFIDAPNEREARLRATDRDVLIASIICTVPDAPAHTVNVVTPSTTPSPGGTPDYPGIVSGAGALRAFASVCNALAVIWFVLGVISFAVAVSHADGYTATIGLVSCSITGFFFLLLAIVIEMLASIGEAVRDTARNSFKG